jgi:hypothetical protein
MKSVLKNESPATTSVRPMTMEWLVQPRCSSTKLENVAPWKGNTYEVSEI